MLNYSRPGKYSNITAADTTLVHTGGGALRGITINKAVAGTIAIYDGVDATGTLIGTITLVENQASGGYFVYNCEVATGICVVTDAAVDITVGYDN